MGISRRSTRSCFAACEVYEVALRTGVIMPEMNKKQIQLKKKAKEAKEAAGKAKQMSAESKKKAAKDAQAYQCTVCRQTFMATAKKAQMQEHIDAKHSKLKKTFAECFPGFI